MSLAEELFALTPAFKEALERVEDQDSLEALRVEFLGRKGLLAEKLAALPDLSPEERPEAGKVGNQVKNELTRLFEAKERELKAEAMQAALADFDPTLPGRTPDAGSMHPVTLVVRDICEVFKGLGFEVVAGPEIETDFHNFEALNMPPDHPARDMQDTLYVSESIVLRTHTSPLQVRTMMERTPPLAAIAPGKVYRRDSDLTHTPMFNQIEGFLVDKDVSLADLRGTLTAFIRTLFGSDTRVRFRPSFFPFTEPSAEVDISCFMCGGVGVCNDAACRVCKTTGWVEILGCGMIDPEVFKALGYDPEEHSGFAFGLGIERIAMLKYGIGDLRMFFENDTRFLQQFACM